MDLKTKSRGCYSKRGQIQVSKPEPGNKRAGEGREEKRNGRRKRGGSADRSLGPFELVRAPAGFHGFLFEVAGMRRGVHAQGPVKPIKRSKLARVYPRSDRERRIPVPPSVAAAGAEEHQGGTVIRSCARLYMVLVEFEYSLLIPKFCICRQG